MNDKSSPEYILHSLGITSPDELDIEAIAFHCGAIVRYRNLDNCSARIVGQSEKAIISVDPRSSMGRKRFSIGHELGHWMRHRGTTAFQCKKDDMRSPWGYRQDPESKANEYAADLLMPAYLFKPLADNKRITFDTVKTLAQDFKASMTATAIRLVQYGSFPSMLVCSSIQGKIWHSSGPEIPDFIWPHKELSHNTQAFELLYGDGYETYPKLIDAEDWINYRYAEGYTVYEHSIKIGDDLVISLIWWKDEQMLIDAIERQQYY